MGLGLGLGCQERGRGNKPDRSGFYSIFFGIMLLGDAVYIYIGRKGGREGEPSIGSRFQVLSALCFRGM